MTFRVHATTSNQEQAAAICLRLQEEEGLADYGTVEDLHAHWARIWPDSAHLLRSLHKYFVIVIQDRPCGARNAQT